MVVGVVGRSRTRGELNMAAPVSESLVDAKNEAVKGELRSEFARAVADLRKDMLRMTQWVIGWVTVVGGVVIAVLR